MMKKTSLHMASDDFSEAKYTESAWTTIAALTKAADYYEATSIEAPLMLDIMLNPSKHSSGGDDKAIAAKKVVEKALSKAGVNVREVRSQLEKYLSKQPRVSGDSSSQKMMGQSLQKVLDAAKAQKEVLGVRRSSVFGKNYTIDKSVLTDCPFLYYYHRILLYPRKVCYWPWSARTASSLARPCPNKT